MAVCFLDLSSSAQRLCFAQRHRQLFDRFSRFYSVNRRCRSGILRRDPELYVDEFHPIFICCGVTFDILNKYERHKGLYHASEEKIQEQIKRLVNAKGYTEAAAAKIIRGRQRQIVKPKNEQKKFKLKPGRKSAGAKPVASSSITSSSLPPLSSSPPIIISEFDQFAPLQSVLSSPDAILTATPERQVGRKPHTQLKNVPQELRMLYEERNFNSPKILETKTRGVQQQRSPDVGTIDRPSPANQSQAIASSTALSRRQGRTSLPTSHPSKRSSLSPNVESRSLITVSAVESAEAPKLQTTTRSGRTATKLNFNNADSMLPDTSSNQPSGNHFNHIRAENHKLILSRKVRVEPSVYEVSELSPGVLSDNGVSRVFTPSSTQFNIDKSFCRIKKKLLPASTIEMLGGLKSAQRSKHIKKWEEILKNASDCESEWDSDVDGYLNHDVEDETDSEAEEYKDLDDQFTITFPRFPSPMPIRHLTTKRPLVPRAFDKL